MDEGSYEPNPTLKKVREISEETLKVAHQMKLIKTQDEAAALAAQEEDSDWIDQNVILIPRLELLPEQTLYICSAKNISVLIIVKMSFMNMTTKSLLLWIMQFSIEFYYKRQRILTIIIGANC